MPELPEVETIRRQLCAAGIEGRVIKKARIQWPRTVEPLTPAVFRRQVEGQKIIRIERHGKWLIFVLDEKKNLLIHLRMTGGFYRSRGAPKEGSHDRAILQLSGGLNLHFRDPRKFGRWRLEPAGGFRSVGTSSSSRWRALLRQRRGGNRVPPSRIKGLGPDALMLTKGEFFAALEGRNKTLKALLLDQSFIAGVGNIYADEALFAARLNPRRKSGTLNDAERSALWKAVRRVLEAGVRNKGTSLGAGRSNYADLNGEAGGHREKVKVYGRAGQPCLTCGRPLHKTRIAQRTTVFCDRCQV